MKKTKSSLRIKSMINFKPISSLLIICLLFSNVISMTAYAAPSLPNNIQTFSGYKISGNGAYATSPDDYFLLKAAAGRIAADSSGAYIEETSGYKITSSLEISVSGTLKSFMLSSATIGEYYNAVSITKNNFTNVYVVGYANGIEVARTDPYNSPDQGTGYEANYSINYTPFQNISIDRFKVYYTAESGTTQDAFNLANFTISNASISPPAPAAPSVTADDAANVILGLDTTMEYQVDGGSYVKYDGSNAPDLSGNRTVLVRVAADAGTGTPAGAITMLTFTANPPAPAAPSVTVNDAANLIVDLDTTMEYQIDGGSYVKYDGTNAPDLSGNRTVLVRVAADAGTGTPAGAVTTLTFTVNPPAPAAPSVTVDDAANVIVGLDTTMEYQIDGGSYVKYNGSNAPDLSGNRTVLVRLAADAGTGMPAGAVTTLTFTTNPPAPAAPSVTANDAANLIVGLDTTMEYQIDGGGYVKYDGSTEPDLSGNRTVLVRVVADAATGTPAGAVTTLTFTTNPPAPAAPGVTANDAANVIVGLDTTMEYQIDGGNYVKYDGSNAPDLSDNRTVLVRVAADSLTGTPAGATKTLTFTANPPAPAAPSVTADDAKNVIVGLDTMMEYQIDGGGYVKYDGSNAPDLSGNRKVLVRVAADAVTGTPVGAVTTLTFTTNPPAPAAPSVTADDAANVIVGLDTTMEYQIDGGSYVKYDGSTEPDLSGNRTILVRVAADAATGTPAGAAKTLTFTANPPAPTAPNVTANDAANVIVGLDTTMEYQIDGNSYVKYDGSNTPDLSGNRTVHVRVAADTTTGTIAGAVTTLTFTANPPAPAAPSVTANDAANLIVGLDTTMEYQIDGGSYVKYDGTNAPDLSGNRTVLVRVAADAGTGTPAGAVTTLTFTANPPAPAVPSVTANDAANVIVGLDTTMEYQIDGGGYVKYDGSNEPDLSGNRTVLVRVAADTATGTLAGAVTTLTFKANPPAPAAPSVTANDATNVIVGLDTTMEYQIDSGGYVKYNGSNALDLSGNRTVLVRVAADHGTATPAGAVTTLIFTANPPAPAAPSVTANDAANLIVGLDTTMEYQVDGGGYVMYDGSNKPGLSGNRTILVRVAADATTGTPAGAVTTLTFTVNPPTTIPTTPNNTGSGVDVLVNGKIENVGVVTTTKMDNRQITSITLDQKKLEAIIEAEGQGLVVTITATSKVDVFVIELNGQMFKNMENKRAVLEIKTGMGTYTLPAQQINIDALSKQFEESGALQDINLKFEIAEPTADMIKVVENAAEKGTSTLVAPPISFTIMGSYGDRTITIEKFDAYVERTIGIPDGVDPSKITTGVVVKPDGSVRHVPTKVKKIDGKYYAVINSLTNSTYTVIWHPVEFEDVVNHWSKTAVNDMGSRMVLGGTGNGQFSPDRNITRAEFAAIIVRGLGLKLESGDSVFSDVKARDWYSSFINTAYAYKLINGHADGSFGPNDNITREQAMAMIAKAMTITGMKAGLPVQSIETTLHPYVDAAKASEWAMDSIADSVQSGIVTGRTSTELAPKAFITRAEVAMIIQRLLQKSNFI